MRVLVTGASGFIGSALLRHLDGDHRFNAVGAIRSPVGSGDVRTIRVGELGSNTDWSHALNGVDAVVHTAARVHIMRETDSDPLQSFRRANVEGTRRLVEQAADSGVQRFVFLSTVKVHGERTSLDRPFRETDAPSPMDPYGVSKLEAEVAVTEVAGRSDLEAVIVRPPLVYGPGVGANFYRMMRWIYRGIPLPLKGVENRRSLIAVDNLVQLLVCCLTSPAAANKVFLASDGEDLSTTELLYQIGDALSRPARLFRVAPRLLLVGAQLAGKESEVLRLMHSLRVDSTNARQTLKWEPELDVAQAIRIAAAAFLRGEQ